MRIFLIVCFLISLAACSDSNPERANFVDPGDASALADADSIADAAADSSTTADVSKRDSIRDAEKSAPDAQTFDDRCASGVCTGQACECSGVTACCDGCFIIHDGQTCDDGNGGTFDDVCGGGVCAGTACECSVGECCDGCLFLPDTVVCEVLEGLGDERMNCTSPTQCGNQLVLETLQGRCTGSSPDCGEMDWYVTAIANQCSWAQRCQIKPGTQSHLSCVNDNICY